MEAQPPRADALLFEHFVELLLRLSDQIFADACPRGEQLLSFLSWLHLDGVQQQRQQQQQKRHRPKKTKGRSVSSAVSLFSASRAAFHLLLLWQRRRISCDMSRTRRGGGESGRGSGSEVEVGIEVKWAG